MILSALLLMTFIEKSFRSTTLSDLFYHPPNIEIDWTVDHTTATAHTGRLAKGFDKVVKLMHDALAHALSPRRSWVVA